MSYRTLDGEVSAELEIKRSRFVAVVARAPDVEAASALVERERQRHHAARHHCSAYVIGPDRALVRAADDGEPGGTAGTPMLTVLLGSGLSDVAAVVTRYFGGTLLGAGGLVRAYGGAVTAALDGAATMGREQVGLYELVVSQARVGALESGLLGRGIAIRNIDYRNSATLTLAVDQARLPELTGWLASMTSGESRPQQIGTDWIDVP